MNDPIPLRKRYFRDVVRMGTLVLLVCLVVLTGFNAVEYVEHRHEGSEELLEMAVLFAALLAVFPVMVWMAWRTSGRLLGPLHELRETVDRMWRGDLEARIPAGRPEDELSELMVRLDEAFEAHREAVRRLERFSADVSHQLRTPLTAMRTAGEACLAQERSAGEYRDTLGGLLEQADRLARVAEQLLMLARVGAGGADPDFQEVELEDLTRRVLEDFRPQCEDRRVEVETLLEQATVKGNPWWLREAMTNLINNALEYTPDPARLRVALRRVEGAVEWSLEDSGPGIGPVRRERIFERFQRGQPEFDGGTGLGLAIVQEVARVHGGELRLEDSDLGGCRFVLWIRD